MVHRHLAAAFADAISRMPGGALPVVGESGRTLEYPAPLLSMLPQLGRTAPGVKSDGHTRTLITEVDPGHRHWSALHWLYPGIFAPIGTDKKQSLKSRTSSHREDFGFSAEQVWISILAVYALTILYLLTDRSSILIILFFIIYCKSCVSHLYSMLTNYHAS